MQIREQGRKIQCIRTVYDKAIGRGRQVVVATVPRWSTSLMPSEDGLVNLTEAEREQLADFLAKRRADSEESTSRYTAMSAETWLITLAKAVREGQTLRPEQAEAIWQGMGEVGKALRKAGYAKPKAVRKAKPAPANAEPDTPAIVEKTPTAKPVRKPRTRKAKSPGNDTGKTE
ncbi:hypothetical protein QB142_004534 [Salmonella enterica]|nr:hypothetical protein [Salmonella enterica]